MFAIRLPWPAPTRAFSFPSMLPVIVGLEPKIKPWLLLHRQCANHAIVLPLYLHQWLAVGHHDEVSSKLSGVPHLTVFGFQLLCGLGSSLDF